MQRICAWWPHPMPGGERRSPDQETQSPLPIWAPPIWTPGPCAGLGSYLLLHVLLKLLLGSFQHPQVVQLGSHLTTGKARLPPASSQGPRVHQLAPLLAPWVLRGALYLIRRGKARPCPPHPAREVLQKHHQRGQGGQRASGLPWVSGEFSHLDFLS